MSPLGDHIQTKTVSNKWTGAISTLIGKKKDIAQVSYFSIKLKRIMDVNTI
jgi:hypothetical protein